MYNCPIGPGEIAPSSPKDRGTAIRNITIVIIIISSSSSSSNTNIDISISIAKTCQALRGTRPVREVRIT